MFLKSIIFNSIFYFTIIFFGILFLPLLISKKLTWLVVKFWAFMIIFLLETIIGPIWVWMVIKEQPSIETISGGLIIILTIAVHSFLALKKT